MFIYSPLSIEWNSIRLSGPAHGIVTKLNSKLCHEVVQTEGGLVVVGLKQLVEV